MISRGTAWKLAVLAVLMLLFATVQGVAHPAPVTSIDTAGASSMITTRPAVVAGRVVFVGDSYTVGYGGDGEGWTTDLAAKHHWDEINVAVGGSGYVPESYGNAYHFTCSTRRHCFSYLDQIKFMADRRAQIIFVSGGRNDLIATTQQVDQDSRKLFAELRSEAPQAKVYVVSPFWSATAYPTWLSAHAAVIRANALREGFTYLDVGSPLYGRTDLLYKDQIHPNARGYAVLAAAVDAKYQAAAG